MGIVTKGGDKGKTSLYRGKRVSKDHIRIEIVGTLDELSSYLGLTSCLIRNAKIKKTIQSIQKDLFLINAEAATPMESLNRLKKRISQKQVSFLEKAIAGLEAKKGLKLKGFCLAGKNQISSNLDIARTIARRAERRVVTLQRKKLLKNEYIVVYLNRLSDLLYLLARICPK